MDFEELRRLYRNEKNNPELSKLEPNFLSELAEYLEKKREEYIKAIKAGIEPSEELHNIERLARELIELRLRKILKKALATKQQELKENLFSEEQTLYENIIKALEDFQKAIDEAFGIKETTAREKVLNMISLEILEDVPAFVGTDLKEYGPFDKGSVIELPAEVAEILLERNLARKR